MKEKLGEKGSHKKCMKPVLVTSGKIGGGETCQESNNIPWLSQGTNLKKLGGTPLAKGSLKKEGGGDYITPPNKR